MADDLTSKLPDLTDPAVIEGILKRLGYRAKKQLCGEQTGHLNQKVGTIEYMPRQRAHYTCNDCGYLGKRGLTPEEQQERLRILNTRITI
jgi:hypothetical protein